MIVRRNRIKQTDSLDVRLALDTKRLRAQANLLPPGKLRADVLRKARQTDRYPHEQMADLARCASDLRCRYR